MRTDRAIFKFMAHLTTPLVLNIDKKTFHEGIFIFLQCDYIPKTGF